MVLISIGEATNECYLFCTLILYNKKKVIIVKRFNKRFVDTPDIKEFLYMAAGNQILPDQSKGKVQNKLFQVWGFLETQ